MQEDYLKIKGDVLPQNYCPPVVVVEQVDYMKKTEKLCTRILCVLVLGQTLRQTHLHALLAVSLGLHVLGQVSCNIKNGGRGGKGVRERGRRVTRVGSG